MASIKKIVKSKDASGLRKFVDKTPYLKSAQILGAMSKEDRVFFFTSLNVEIQAELFEKLSIDTKELLASELSNDNLKILIEELYTEEAADIFENLDVKRKNKILSLIDPKLKKEIKRILNYDEDEVGSIMSTDILTLKQSWTVGKALEELKSQIDDIHFSRNFYVVDFKGKLVGYVKMRDFIFENKKKSIKNFIKSSTSVKTTSDKEDAAQIFAKHGMTSLPVVDNSGQVVGVITSDSVIDIIQEETEEDFQVMAGIKATETPYSKSKIFSLFKSRILWLLLLMISSTLSQIILDAFINIASEQLHETTKVALSVGITSAIVTILPVISGAAGNAGSQSSTTIIRALATGDISSKNYLKVFSKEFRTSSILGFALGVANFARLLIYYSAKGHVDEIEYIALSGAASLALMLVVMISQVVGGMLPLIAKGLKLDPAVMAAPVLTTLIDALSTLIFFGISIGIMILVI